MKSIFNSFFIACLISASSFNFLKSSEHPIKDQLSTIYDSIWNLELRLNTVTPRTHISTETKYKSSCELNHERYIPLIGSYGNPYVFLNKLAFISIDPVKYADTMPATLIKNLKNIFKSNSSLTEKSLQTLSNKEFLSFLIDNNKIDLKSFIILWGRPIIDSKPWDRTYNIAFHPTVTCWLEDEQNFNPLDYSTRILMGIFGQEGISKTPDWHLTTSITFENFNEDRVIVHPVEDVPAYSPNNAGFVLNQDRDIYTFWVAAISPDQQNIIISYNILIDNDDLEDTLAFYINPSKLDLNKLIQGIKYLVDNSTAGQRDTLTLYNTQKMLESLM